jgi:competence protein ComEA
MSHRARPEASPDEADHQLVQRLVRPPLPEPPHDAAPRARRRTRRTRPASWRHRLGDRIALVAARTGVTPRAVVGLVLLGVAIAGVLLVRLLLAQHQAQPVPLRLATTSGTAGPVAAASPTGVALTTPTSAAPSAVVAASTDSRDGGATAEGTVLVHVVGQVRHPGVVRLPTGARVEQALESAGGATSKADLVRVNLARPVVDGEQIVVPKPGQPIAGAPTVQQLAGRGGGPASGPGDERQQPVDLNTAGVAQLDELPGVGPVLAQRILDWRAENGRFSSVDELAEVSGIGEKVLDKLRPLVRV